MEKESYYRKRQRVLKNNNKFFICPRVFVEKIMSTPRLLNIIIIIIYCAGTLARRHLNNNNNNDIILFCTHYIITLYIVIVLKLGVGILMTARQKVVDEQQLLTRTGFLFFLIGPPSH